MIRSESTFPSVTVLIQHTAAYSRFQIKVVFVEALRTILTRGGFGLGRFSLPALPAPSLFRQNGCLSASKAKSYPVDSADILHDIFLHSSIGRLVKL